MEKNRLEAFSDGVLAIVITIMVLELKPPNGHSLDALAPVAHTLLSYVLSFIYVAIYWNNHHHMLHLAHRVNGKIMWANMHLLFWLSLTPFVTAWVGGSHFEREPVGAYGVVLLMAAVAYTLLQGTIIRDQGADSALRSAVGADWKGKVSVLCYVSAIVFSLWTPWAPLGVYWLVAMIWIVPDRRIERRLRA